MASIVQPSIGQLRVFLAGRVAVEADGVVLDAGRFAGRQGRLVFAYLVAERGRAVPRDELAEALWGEAPPATWDKALTVIASKLRGGLTDAGVDGGTALTGAFGCYRLDLPEGTWVDVTVATDSVDAAEAALAAGELEEARKAAGLAAALVRQPFLPGEAGAWVDEKRRELADLQGRALTVLRDACLRLGDAAEATKWADQVVALEPFREAGYRRLMEAHAAAGNRAEALQVYERCRRLLAEELGAYPSPETSSIYRELLAAPALAEEAPAAPAAAEPEEEPARAPARRGRRRRRLAAAVVVAGVIAATVAVPLVVFGQGGSGGRSAVSAAGDSLGLVDARSGRIVADTGVGATPAAVAAGEGAYWVTNAGGNTVSRIDPGATARVETIPVGNGPSGIAIGAGAVWVVNSLDATVSRIDPEHEHGRPADRCRQPTRGDRLHPGLRLGREQGRRDDHEDRRAERQSGEEIPDHGEPACIRRRRPVGERPDERTVSSGSSRRRAVSSRRSGSGMEPPASRTAAARRGWRTAWTGRCRASIRRRTRSSRPDRPATARRRSQPTRAGSGSATSSDGRSCASIRARTTSRAAVAVGNRPQGIALKGGTLLVSVRQSGSWPSRRDARAAG